MSMYDDIINIPHWDPKHHRRMSAQDRAAQFAPFSALTGYDAMVRERARLTDSRAELDEEQILALNETLSTIMARVNDQPRVAVTWFRKDARKQGGAYQRTEGIVRNVDLTDRLIVFREGGSISMDDIAAISILEGPGSEAGH